MIPRSSAIVGRPCETAIVRTIRPASVENDITADCRVLSRGRTVLETGKWDPIAVLRNAVDMEVEGKAFFERVAQHVSHSRTRVTFLSLAKQEERHIKVIDEELRHLEKGKGWLPLEEAKSSPRISVFKDKDIKRIKLVENAGELEALKLGIEVEKRSIEYYRSASLSTDDRNAKEVFNWLVGEEAGHLTILTAEYDYRSGTGFYYDNAEFSLEVM